MKKIFNVFSSLISWLGLLFFICLLAYSFNIIKFSSEFEDKLFQNFYFKLFAILLLISYVLIKAIKEIKYMSKLEIIFKFCALLGYVALFILYFIIGPPDVEGIANLETRTQWILVDQAYNYTMITHNTIMFTLGCEIISKIIKWIKTNNK